MARRKTVHLTEPQIKALLGAIDFAEVYLEDAEDTHGNLTRSEALAKKIFENAANALREGLDR